MYLRITRESGKQIMKGEKRSEKSKRKGTKGKGQATAWTGLGS